MIGARGKGVEEAVVGAHEQRWRHGVSRREALAGLATFLAASPLLHAQRDPWPLDRHRRILGFDEMLTAFDFEPVFRANVPLAVYDYTAHGTDSEFTLQRNRDAFDWVELVGRGGVDPKAVDTSTALFGVPMTSPIMLAPTSRQRDLHPDAELGMHRAATTTSTTMIVSNASSFPFRASPTRPTGRSGISCMRDAISRPTASRWRTARRPARRPSW